MADYLATARVFVIDDNAVNVELVRAVLGQAGMLNVFTETDPRQVMARMPVIDPDLVILDLHMPHLDGFEVLEQIRRWAPVEYLPVLVLTADTTSLASEKALHAGAQDFVTKPFSNTELLLRTRSLLKTRFLSTTLRSSVLRAEREHELEELRFTKALISGQETTERLRLLGELKDTLLQTVSHDLRNPIAAVLIMVGLLAADAEGTQTMPDEMRASVIAKVGVAARTIQRLLTDLLDSDPMRTISDNDYVCDVGELVQRVLADGDVLGSEYEVETDIASVLAKINPVHVERIVENLLSNARHHVAPGVAIWVRTAAYEDGVLISVEDAGAGVSPEAAETIFEPFRRGANPRSQGLGLGLSLVSRFAQLHGGRAWVETRPGGGAAFRVFLPSHLVPDQESAAHSRDPAVA